MVCCQRQYRLGLTPSHYAATSPATSLRIDKEKLDQMLTFKALAGDFRKDGKHQFLAKDNLLLLQKAGWRPKFEKINLAEIETIEVASEESVKKVWGTVAGGAAGAVLLGPLGLLAGVLTGGNRKEVVFVCKFKDGRKLMAKCKNRTYQAIQEAMF